MGLDGVPSLHGAERGSLGFKIVYQNDFSKGMAASGTEVRRLPLYAAHCVGQGCMKAGL